MIPSRKITPTRVARVPLKDSTPLPLHIHTAIVDRRTHLHPDGTPRLLMRVPNAKLDFIAKMSVENSEHQNNLFTLYHNSVLYDHCPSLTSIFLLR